MQLLIYYLGFYTKESTRLFYSGFVTTTPNLDGSTTSANTIVPNLFYFL